VPGPVGVRPVYAPALVAFVGGGGGVSIGVGGPVGWFPLGPHEVYNPWYHVSRGYYTNVNVANIYGRGNRTVVINDINNRYNYFRDGRAVPNERFVNRDVPHAFRAMPGQDFVAARNARQHMAAIDPQRFAGAQVAPRGVSGIAPVRASFAPPRANTARPLPAGGFQREVVARTPPAANFGSRPVNGVGTPRMAPSQGNVRLLNGQGPGMRGATPNRPQEFSGAQPNAPARGNVPAAAGRPMPRSDNEPVATRPGELPSTRYARPNGQSPYQRGENNQPRPGVSYIPSAESDRMRGQQPSPGTLPTPARIEPVQPQQAQRPSANQDNAERFQRDNAMQRQDMQQRQAAQQQEMQQRQAMQQQTQQREAMQRQQQMQQRQEMQQRYEPPHGNGQQPQPQAPRPENNQQHQQQPSHEEHHAPARRDDQQHN
jgi:hypothetical protein